MLRRIPILAFALLLFLIAFAFPVPRSSAAPADTTATTDLAALFLPSVAAAQAVRDTIDTLGTATTRSTTVAPAPMVATDTVTRERHFHPWLISGIVLLIVVLAIVAWQWSKRVDYGEANSSSRGTRSP
jgi:hypothetical protein